MQILYADSLVVSDAQIPDDKPRIAAWSRQLLDKVIRLDRNRDGSFGKLKVHFLFLPHHHTATFFLSKEIHGVTFFLFSQSLNQQDIRWLKILFSTWMMCIPL